MGSTTSPFRNITVFGAGGTNIGYHIVQALAADPTFTVTVLARASSKTSFPSNIRTVRVQDDFPHSELVEALRGQEVVISAVGFEAKKNEFKLIDAAIEAGVKRFFPSEYGLDNSDPKTASLVAIFGIKNEMQKYLKSKQEEGLTWTSVATGMWLDWALAPGMTFTGIDIAAHTVSYWTKDGTHTPSWTTLPFAAQGVVQALKHPDETENTIVFVHAFEASQQQIVAELERQQSVKYEASDLDAEAVMEESKAKWEGQGDVGAAYMLVQGAFLLPEYGTDFVKSGKKLGDGFMELPKLTLEEVVADVLKDFK